MWGVPDVPGDGGEVALLWTAMTPLGFLVLAAVIIALGASSTAKYEFELNRVQTQRTREVAPVAAVGGSAVAPAADEAGADSPAAHEPRPERRAVGVATHPAGRQRVDPAAEPAWWLVDDSADRAGGHLVAGPFGDRIDAGRLGARRAGWGAGRAGGGAGGGRGGPGVPRPDGGLVRRQSPEERAWLSELGGQLDRLPEEWDELLTDDDALTTLVVEVAAALVEAGLPVHDCAGEDPAGGVCLTPGPHHAGVVVSWHQHERMSAGQVRGAAVVETVQEAMNATLDDVLTAMGFEVEVFDAGGSLLITDIRGGDPGC